MCYSIPAISEHKKNVTNKMPLSVNRKRQIGHRKTILEQADSNI